MLTSESSKMALVGWSSRVANRKLAYAARLRAAPWSLMTFGDQVSRTSRAMRAPSLGRLVETRTRVPCLFNVAQAATYTQSPCLSGRYVESPSAFGLNSNVGASPRTASSAPEQ